VGFVTRQLEDDVVIVLSVLSPPATMVESWGTDVNRVGSPLRLGSLSSHREWVL